MKMRGVRLFTYALGGSRGLPRRTAKRLELVRGKVGRHRVVKQVIGALWAENRPFVLLLNRQIQHSCYVGCMPEYAPVSTPPRTFDLNHILGTGWAWKLQQVPDHDPMGG